MKRNTDNESDMIKHNNIYGGLYNNDENDKEENDDEKKDDEDANKEDKRTETDNVGIGLIMRNGAVTTKSDGMTIHCLTIIGQIEGHYILGNTQKTTKYEHIIPLIISVEDNDLTDGLLIVLNTVGGDVEAGLALAELIASMKKPTVSLVLGGGHSIGVPLAVSAKHSFIVPTATMTLHPVRMNGLVVSAPQTYYYFSRIQERILNFISGHSKVSSERLRELIMQKDEIATDIGSILDGNEAVAKGLIDEVGGLSQAIKCLKDMIRKGKAENKIQE